MTNGQNVARSRHLEELARAAKRYTLREILDVTEAVAAELGGLSSADYSDFTGATSITGGLSGLVPAPQAGDESKFLRGDGTWASVESGSAGSGAIDYVIGSNVSTVEGGFWQDIYNDVPILKLRHGDYEYNFQYDGLTRVSDNDTAVATVTPDTYVLGTASVSNDGGVWYEVNSNNVPTLNLHKGNFNYSFNYDSITYKGNNANLVAYLPFDISTTADACGNEWTATGNPTIVDGALYLGGSSWLENTRIADILIYQPSFTVDFWATADTPAHSRLFGSRQYYSDAPVSIIWDNGSIQLQYNNSNETAALNLAVNTRHHYALSFGYKTAGGSKLGLFVDGVLVAEMTASTSITNIVIGAGAQHEYSFHGSIDHFRIWRTAIWAENFTPPTAADYL